MTATALRRCLLLFAFCVMYPLVATAQQATGTIGGTVQDASGAVMPGVTMTLASPGIIGGNQTAVTDARGTYQFVRLVPATYSVKAELQGFRSALRENIVVQADVTARVDLTIEVGNLEETITVSGAAPLLDTTTTQKQTVMDRKTLEAIPSGNNLWAIGAIVPGVLNQKIDVGGNESFQASGQKVHGSNDTENRYMIDGMSIGGSNGGGGGIFGYQDALMFEEINYLAGQAPAENQQGGVVMNMVTRTGTNTLHGTLDVSGSRQAFMSNNISPTQLQQLTAGIPARLLQLNPSLAPSNAVPYIYDAGGYLGGPIKRDKVWWVFTARQQGNNQIQLGTYNSDGTLAHDDNAIKNASGKISWQATAKNQVSVFYNRNQKWRYHRRAADFPGAVFVEDRATVVQDQPTDTVQAKWTSPISSKLLFEASGSYLLGYFERKPQPEVQHGDISRLDLVTQVGSVANPFYPLSIQDTWVFKSSLSYVTGAHNFKFGYQLDGYGNESTAYSVSHYPSGLVAQYRNGVPDSAVLYNTPFDGTTVSHTNAVYVQDKWTPAHKLTVNLGLRFQKTLGYVPAACQTATIFVTGVCYPREEGLPDWMNWAPRFGLVYDVFGDGKTALKMTANRYYLGTASGYGDRVNPVHSATSTVPWTDTNLDSILQVNELNLAASTGFNLGTTNRYAPDVRNAYSTELSGEIEQQLFGDLVVTAGYYYRAIRDNIGSRNVLVPTASYIPLAVTEAVSGRQVTVYNQDPATRGKFDVVYANDPAMNEEFHGVDVNFIKRMSHRWMVMGGYSYGKNTADTYGDTSDLNNPNFTFRNGPVITDVPQTFKASGVYDAPLGIRISGSVQHYTGFPESTTVSVTSATVRLTQVTQSLRVEPVGTERLPSNNIANVRFAKVLHVGHTRGQITPALDIFNVTNSNTPQNLVTLLGPTYGRVSSASLAGGGSGILRPRMFRFGAIMTF